MKNFRDKTIYITGGSSGIGLAAANMLAAKGAHIIIFARSKDRLYRAIEKISNHRQTKGQRFSAMQLDVSERQAVETVMSRAVSEFGIPDVLINCAGIATPRYFEEITGEQLEETMKVNLYGIWNTVSVLAPVMKERGGYIVNTSSVAGLIGVFGYTDYCASKFAVNGFSEALRSELKPCGIKVSILCPPDTDTPGLEKENKTKPEETKALAAHAKLLQPDDVARTLIQGMEKEKHIIIPGFESKVIHLAKRLIPWLVERNQDKVVKRIRKRRIKES